MKTNKTTSLNNLSIMKNIIWESKLIEATKQKLIQYVNETIDLLLNIELMPEAKEELKNKFNNILTAKKEIEFLNSITNTN